MARYRFGMEMLVSHIGEIVVEADSPEEALDKAEQLSSTDVQWDNVTQVAEMSVRKGPTKL